MATIALNGLGFNFSSGINSFYSLNHSINNSQKTSERLHDSLLSLKKSVDSIAEKCNNTDSQHNINTLLVLEETKITSLTIGYQNIDKLISDSSSIDNSVSEKIEQNANDFYKEYGYLKPVSEKKGAKENAKKLLKNISEWCLDHLDIIVAIAVVAVAILIVVIASIPATFVACIAGIVGLVLLAVDIISMCCCNGKTIPELLKNKHPVLSKILKGLQLGCDIVQIFFPIGAAVKMMSKVGVKLFFKSSFVALKHSLKEAFESVFKCGFKKGAKNAFTLCVKKLLFDWDDLKINKIYLKTTPYRLSENNKNVFKKGNKIFASSENAKKIFNKYDITSIDLMKNKDLNWKKYAFEITNLDMKKIDISMDKLEKYLYEKTFSETQMSSFIRNADFEQGFENICKKYNLSYNSKKEMKEVAQNKLNQLGREFFTSLKPNDSFTTTQHEFFSTTKDFFVPYDLHALIPHYGAVNVFKNTLKNINNTILPILRNSSLGTIRTSVSLVFD